MKELYIPIYTSEQLMEIKELVLPMGPVSVDNRPVEETEQAFCNLSEVIEEEGKEGAKKSFVGITIRREDTGLLRLNQALVSDVPSLIEKAGTGAVLLVTNKDKLKQLLIQ